MRPLVISHAACGGHAPENTLAGIRKAMELGADAIEIDVQATADGVPVLMHDLTVDRSTSGSGAVANLTLEEMRRLDAGGEPPPTLAEVLALTRGKVLLVTELKAPGAVDQIAAVIRESGALEDVMAWSFFPRALEGMRGAEPRIPCGLLIAPESLPRWPEMRTLAVKLGAQAVSVFCYGLTEPIAGEAQRRGLSVYAWTADPEAEIARLIALGIDGICTNYPDRAVALLAGR